MPVICQPNGIQMDWSDCFLNSQLSCGPRYDGTVRNSAGDVVQFLYGEDGMDAVRIEEQVRAAHFCIVASLASWPQSGRPVLAPMLMLVV